MLRAPGAIDGVLLQLTPGQKAVIFALILVGLIVKALVLWWLYLDTTQRGREPLWWLVAAVPFDIPTLIVWLIVRPPETPTHAAGRWQEGENETGVDDPLGAAPNETATHDLAPAPIPQQPTGEGVLLRVTCPHCGTQFKVTKQAGPQDVQCPSCERTGTLPASP